jgi:hypothetical protein
MTPIKSGSDRQVMADALMPRLARRDSRACHDWTFPLILPDVQPEVGHWHCRM